MPSFSPYADTYTAELERSYRFIGQKAEFFTEVKAAEVLACIRRRLGPTERLHLLDVGCGPGLTDACLLPHLGRLTGVDVSDAMVERAARDNPGASYMAYDGHVLPLEDSSVDVTIAINVVHHVPPGAWGGFVAELARVTRAGGLAVIAEHNPLNPLTRVAVARCAFDEDAVLLGPRRARGLLEGAGAEIVECRYILFFPWSGRRTRMAERHLGRVPLGAQYVVAGRVAG